MNSLACNALKSRAFAQTRPATTHLSTQTPWHPLPVCTRGRLLLKMGELDNCITEASTRSIIAGSMPQNGANAPSTSSGGGGGSSQGGSGNGGGDGSSGSNGDGAEGGQPHKMQLWTYVFAGIVAVGGIMGFAKRGSSKSLGGGLSGALVLGLAARSMTGPTAAAGAQVAFGISLLLGIFFLARFAKTKKVMPGGVGAGVSLGMACGYLVCGL